MARRIKVR
jgi:hypothetical protein